MGAAEGLVFLGEQSQEFAAEVQVALELAGEVGKSASGVAGGGAGRLFWKTAPGRVAYGVKMGGGIMEIHGRFELRLVVVVAAMVG